MDQAKKETGLISSNIIGTTKELYEQSQLLSDIKDIIDRRIGHMEFPPKVQEMREQSSKRASDIADQPAAAAIENNRFTVSANNEFLRALQGQLSQMF